MRNALKLVNEILGLCSLNLKVTIAGALATPLKHCSSKSWLTLGKKRGAAEDWKKSSRSGVDTVREFAL